MKHIFLSFIILFSLNSCEDNANDSKANQEKEVLAQKRAKMLQEHQKALEKIQATPIKKAPSTTKDIDTSTLSSNTGIVVKDGMLSIDTNKTKAFIQGLSNQLDMKIDTIKKDLTKGIIKNKEAGIDISSNGVSIDLNKTKAVISHWTKQIESFVQTFDEKTETNTTK